MSSAAGSSDGVSAAPARGRAVRPFEPQLAGRVEGPLPSRHPWWFERKYDGIRLLVHVAGDGVVLRTRPGTDRTANFPVVVAAVTATGLTDAVLDAELVAFDGDGRDRFGLLQRRLGRPGRTPGGDDVRIRLMVFDLLRIDGHDLRSEPLRERRARLDGYDGLRDRAVDDPVGLAPTFEGDADRLLDRACRDGWEGLIAKRADAPYRAGRSSSWRKLVCTTTRPFVIGGWTPPSGTRAGLGAILVGTPSAAGLEYRGRVGTGLDDATLRTLAAHLQRAQRETSPFVEPPDDPGGTAVLWCVPHLVAEVRYLGVTEAGRLRQARLVALRPDLPAEGLTDQMPDDSPDDRLDPRSV